MESVTRYDYNKWANVTLDEDLNGQFVKHSDYDLLRRENERLREALKESLEGLHTAHACATWRPDGTCEGCFVSIVVDKLHAALAMSEPDQKEPPTEVCNQADERRARNGGYSLRCVKPKGHEGNHEDCTGCWWQ